MKIISLLLIALFSFNVSASQPKAKEVKKEERKVVLKKGGAVTAFSEEDGFKLSKKAIKNLDVKFKIIGSGSHWDIPKSSLVRIKSSTGVYRKYDGWITMVLVNVVNKSKTSVRISSVDLQEGDEVATSGVKFLRMTDADLNSDTVDACAH